jgi:hypothetical protein
MSKKLTEKEAFIGWYKNKYTYFEFPSDELIRLNGLFAKDKNHIINTTFIFTSQYHAEKLWPIFLEFIYNKTDIDLETYFRYKNQ